MSTVYYTPETLLTLRKTLGLPIPKVCLRCGHHWKSRVENPVRCAKCRSKYWSTEPRRG